MIKPNINDVITITTKYPYFLGGIHENIRVVGFSDWRVAKATSDVLTEYMKIKSSDSTIRPIANLEYMILEKATGIRFTIATDYVSDLINHTNDKI